MSLRGLHEIAHPTRQADATGFDLSLNLWAMSDEKSVDSKQRKGHPGTAVSDETSKRCGDAAPNGSGTKRWSHCYKGSLLRSRSARDRWISICWIAFFSRIFRSGSASNNHPKPRSSKKTISFFLSMVSAPLNYLSRSVRVRDGRFAFRDHCCSLILVSPFFEFSLIKIDEPVNVVFQTVP